MSDESREQRAIARVIESTRPDFEGRAAVLTGWVLVSEWADDAGDAWTEKLGSHGSPSWRLNGLLYHGLHDYVEAEDEGGE